jgi:glycosyltransferase involved in cell wall biosynthesis
MSTLRVVRQDNASLTAGDTAASRHEPGLTVVIPYLNECMTIAEAVMQAQSAFAHWPEGMEIIVADNGSTDGSAELARVMGARVVAALERGYGAALQVGFAAARTSYIVYADADLTYASSRGRGNARIAPLSGHPHPHRHD